jgi:tellurite methyltransferase
MIAIVETATAHHAWDERWRTAAGRADWVAPEADVLKTLEQLKARGGRCVLDLGCGVGRHTVPMAALGFDTHGYDASPSGLAHLASEAERLGLAITTAQGAMTALPYADAQFDYILAFNVIYHGDGAVVARTIAEIARVLKPGGRYQGTMLSKRNALYGIGREIAPNTFVAETPAPGTDDADKVHPHFYCNAAELVRLFGGFELLSLDDREHARPGSWHWHMLAERR